MTQSQVLLTNLSAGRFLLRAQSVRAIAKVSILFSTMDLYPNIANRNCLSLADGFHGKCTIVYAHNNDIGASKDDVVIIPDELAGEFEKLSTTIHSLGRAFELGIIHE